MEHLDSHWTDFNYILYFRIFRKICRENSSFITVTGTLHEYQYTFLFISCSVLLIMRNVSDKRFTENRITHFMFTHVFFENLVVYEIMWEKNIVERDRPQLTMCRVRIACWITKATNTHSDYVIFCAFPLQHWLHERAPLLRYTTYTQTHIKWSLGCF
jgi:hypothetical protein